MILRIALPKYSTFLGLMSLLYMCNFVVHASREKLEAFLLCCMEGGLISDGVLAQDINQAFSFWHIREVLLLNIFVGITIDLLTNIRVFLSYTLTGVVFSSTFSFSSKVPLLAAKHGTRKASNH